MVLLVLCMSIVAADLRIVLTTPQAKFTVINGESIDYYIGVENKNNFTINVDIVPSDLNIVFYNDTSFALQPNETRNVMYTITVNESGNYTKTISVTYSGNNEDFTLQQQIYFIVSDVEKESSTSSSSSSKKTSKTKNVTTVNTAADFEVVATNNDENIEEPLTSTQHNITITSTDDSSDSKKKGKTWSYIVVGLFMAVFIFIIIQDIIESRKNKQKQTELGTGDEDSEINAYTDERR